MTQPLAETATELLAIDHLALRVGDPAELAGFLCEHCGMERSEGDEGFLIVGAPGGSTRLFLFEAEEPTDPGVLQRVVLRVADLGAALERLPRGVRAQEIEPGTAVFQGPQGLELGLASVLGGGVDFDVDHLVLRVMNRDDTATALAELGFVPSGSALHVADKHIRLESGIRSSGDNELLGHIGVSVQSVEAVKGQVLRGGLQFDELTLGPNRLGVYVRGPERLRVEYSEAG